MVPEFEEREAAVYANYNWSDWELLSVGERATCVAQYRMHHTIEAHVQDAVNAEMEKSSKKGAHR